MSILMSFHNDQPNSVEKMGTPFCFKVYYDLLNTPSACGGELHFISDI